jgi:hypothetical protein
MPAVSLLLFQARSLSLQGWSLIDLSMRASFQSSTSFSRIAWSILNGAHFLTRPALGAPRRALDPCEHIPIVRGARAQEINRLHPLTFVGYTQSWFFLMMRAWLDCLTHRLYIHPGEAQGQHVLTSEHDVDEFFGW